MAELNIKIYFVWHGKDFCELDLRANIYNILAVLKIRNGPCGRMTILTKIKSYPFMLVREVIYYIDYPKERRPAALAMTHADITFFFLRPSFGVIICEADRQSTNTRNGTSQRNIIPFVWGNVYNTLPG